MQTVVELVAAPALVVVSSLAAGRWGARAGGIVSAFPAVVGPLLLIVAHEHGAAFAARAANGTLLGLVALAAFAVAYGRTALRAGWQASLAAGWAAAGVAGAVAGAVGGAAPTGLIVAALSLALAFVALPMSAVVPGPVRMSRLDIALRAVLTLLLVAALAAAAGVVGALVGGVLAALPVLASVLAVFTHRRHGAPGVVALLRGMVAGMAGFVAFCQVVAVLAAEGIALAFLAAAAAAVAVQASIPLWSRYASSSWDASHPAGVVAPTARR